MLSSGLGGSAGGRDTECHFKSYVGKVSKKTLSPHSRFSRLCEHKEGHSADGNLGPSETLQVQVLLTNSAQGHTGFSVIHFLHPHCVVRKAVGLEACPRSEIFPGARAGGRTRRTFQEGHQSMQGAQGLGEAR